MTTRFRCCVGHRTAGDHLEGRIPVSSLVCVLPAASAVDPPRHAPAGAPIATQAYATHVSASARAVSAIGGRSAVALSLQPKPTPASASPASPGYAMAQVRHPRGLPTFALGIFSASKSDPLDGAPIATPPVGGGYPEPISVSSSAAPPPVETAAAANPAPNLLRPSDDLEDGLSTIRPFALPPQSAIPGVAPAIPLSGGSGGPPEDPPNVAPTLDYSGGGTTVGDEDFRDVTGALFHVDVMAPQTRRSTPSPGPSTGRTTPSN